MVVGRKTDKISRQSCGISTFGHYLGRERERERETFRNASKKNDLKRRRSK
jgi:hypothetical protein